VLLRRRVEAGWIDFGDCHQLHAGIGGDHAKVMLGVAATADDGDLEDLCHESYPWVREKVERNKRRIFIPRLVNLIASAVCAQVVCAQ
jgi:hypothetical protein